MALGNDLKPYNRRAAGSVKDELAAKLPGEVERC
jgi:hypothetical protein